jgi:hypothetical protein
LDLGGSGRLWDIYRSIVGSPWKPFFIESSFASGQVAGCNMKIQDVKYGTGHSS